MEKKCLLSRVPFALLAILFVVSSSCTNPISSLITKEEQSPPEPVIVVVQGEEGGSSASETSPEPEAGDLVLSEEGFSRSNPYPMGVRVSLPGWDIGVIEFLRGAAALEIIDTENWQAPELPSGQEYAVAKVFVRRTADIGGSLGSYDVPITGSSNTIYLDHFDGHPVPEFVFEDMFTAESVEGWIDVIIPTDETDLMLMYNLRQNDEQVVRFFALEEGASISLSADLANTTPNEIGLTNEIPARVGETIITQDWVLTVLVTIRGDEAQQIMQQDNEYYEPPNAGYEFVLMEVDLTYIRRDDFPESIYPGDFYSIGTDGYSNSEDVLYLPENRQWVKYTFLPGAHFRGWVALSIPTGSVSPTLVFNPDQNGPYGSPYPNRRYFTIE